MEREHEADTKLETPLPLELDVEELEAIIAPSARVVFNSNETLVADPEELQLEIEELEPIVAPAGRIGLNSNETLARISHTH